MKNSERPKEASHAIPPLDECRTFEELHARMWAISAEMGRTLEAMAKVRPEVVQIVSALLPVMLRVALQRIPGAPTMVAPGSDKEH